VPAEEKLGLAAMPLTPLVHKLEAISTPCLFFFNTFEA
jgi:hypothetical protein